MNIKRTAYILAGLLFLSLSVFVFFKYRHVKGNDQSVSYNDGLERINADTIYLDDSKVTVTFSDVILSEQNETRKLIVVEQNGTVSAELTNNMVEYLNVDWLKKSQKVTYTGKGYFVVDLDKLTKKDIVDDTEKKILTIKIDHPYLETIDIDPNNVIIDEVKESLLARGDIKLTLNDYNTIEKELRDKLEKKFNTVENGQKADDIALKMVKSVYEPVVKAVNDDYEVEVVFK